MDRAVRVGAPVIGINDSGGARIQEGVASLAGYAEVFQRNVLASGVVPQISVICGAVRRRCRLQPGDDRLHLHGPGQLLHVRHRSRGGAHGDQRGGDPGGGARRGASTHTRKSGVADLASLNDVEAMAQVRRFFDFLPLSSREQPPSWPTEDPAHRVEASLDTLVPSNPNMPYDMKELITKIVDEADFFEVQPDYAKNIVIGLARMEGTTVGIVANQPLVLAGCLDIDSSRKAARFVRFCDSFNIPILTLVGRARLPAGNGTGIWRHHQARRQAAVRLRRGHGAQGHADHQEGLWRRLRRHVVEGICAAMSIMPGPPPRSR